MVAGLVLVVLVALVVARPLIARGEGDGPQDAEHREAAERRVALEAAKEAKYREIRDAELDFRMGKLSEADYRVTDRELRAQAITILAQIDALEGRSPDGDGAAR